MSLPEWKGSFFANKIRGINQRAFINNISVNPAASKKTNGHMDMRITASNYF